MSKATEMQMCVSRLMMPAVEFDKYILMFIAAGDIYS